MSARRSNTLPRDQAAVRLRQGGVPSRRVIEVLSQLVSVHGAPRYLRSDNGPEFVSRALLRWASEAGIDTALIDPGKPWQNGSDESFKLRDECLVSSPNPGHLGTRTFWRLTARRFR